MKKFLTILLAACAVSLSSCNIKGLIDELTSLDGTTWVGTSTPNAAKPNEVVTITCVFTTASYTATAVDQAGKTVATEKGTYSYLAPIVTTKSEAGQEQIGTISGNKLTFGKIEYTKK